MSKRRIIRKVKKESTPRPYSCDKCGVSFTKERFLKTHITKQPNCDNKHVCAKCNKEFGDRHGLKSHMDRKTPCAPEKVPVLTITNEENKCRYCSKSLSSKYNLERHMRTCAQLNKDNLIRLLEEERRNTIKEMLHQQSQLASHQPRTVNITNNTLNVQNNIVVVVGYGQEDLSQLDLQEIKQLMIENAQDFIPRMIKNIHANPDRSDYHNIYFDVPKNQAMAFIQKGEKLTWELKDINDVSKQLTDKVKSHVINNQELNSLFKTADDDEDWEKFANNIHIINGLNGDEPELIEANKGVLAEAKSMCMQIQEVN